MLHVYVNNDPFLDEAALRPVLIRHIDRIRSTALGRGVVIGSGAQAIADSRKNSPRSVAESRQDLCLRLLSDALEAYSARGPFEESVANVIKDHFVFSFSQEGFIKLHRPSAKMLTAGLLTAFAQEQDFTPEPFAEELEDNMDLFFLALLKSFRTQFVLRALDSCLKETGGAVGFCSALLSELKSGREIQPGPGEAPAYLEVLSNLRQHGVKVGPTLYKVVRHLRFMSHGREGLTPFLAGSADEGFG